MAWHWLLSMSWLPAWAWLLVMTILVMILLVACGAIGNPIRCEGALGGLCMWLISLQFWFFFAAGWAGYAWAKEAFLFHSMGWDVSLFASCRQGIGFASVLVVLGLYVRWEWQNYEAVKNCKINNSDLKECPNKDQTRVPDSEWCGQREGGTKIWLLKRTITYVLFFAALISSWYGGQFYTLQKIRGNCRLSMRHPTKHDCNALHQECRVNISKPENQPYCEQSGQQGKQKHAIHRIPCVIKDSFELSTPVITDTLFVPTRKSLHHQETCDGELLVESDDGLRRREPQHCHFKKAKSEDFYLTDIESFTLLFDHGFTVMFKDGTLGEGWNAGGQHGKLLTGHTASVAQTISDIMSRRLDATASLDKLKYLKFIEHSTLMHYDMPNKSEQRIKEYPSVVSLEVGDVISVGDLLKIADRSLDERWGESSLRWNGGELLVQITYANSGSWFLTEPRYVLSAGFSLAQQYKNEYSTVTDKGRVIHSEHGLLIRVLVTGNIYQFDLEPSTIIAVIALAVAAFFQYDKMFEDYVRPFCSFKKGYEEVVCGDAKHEQVV